MDRSVTLLRIFRTEFFFYVVLSLCAVFLSTIAFAVLTTSNPVAAPVGLTLIFILIISPLIGITIRKSRITSSLNSGLCGSANIVINTENASHFNVTIAGTINHHHISYDMDIVNNKHTRAVLKSELATLCCNQNYRHPIIRELYA